MNILNRMKVSIPCGSRRSQSIPTKPTGSPKETPPSQDGRQATDTFDASLPHSRDGGSSYRPNLATRKPEGQSKVSKLVKKFAKASLPVTLGTTLLAMDGIVSVTLSVGPLLALAGGALAGGVFVAVAETGVFHTSETEYWHRNPNIQPPVFQLFWPVLAKKQLLEASRGGSRDSFVNKTSSAIFSIGHL